MSDTWTRWARRARAALLFHTGATHLLSGAEADRFILGYHRVLSDRDDDRGFVQPGMYVSLSTFEAHLKYLTARYKVLPLEELTSTREGRACAITFDDGWQDTYAVAFPLLRRYSVPATVFVASSLVGTTAWPWPDRISHYLHECPAIFRRVLWSAWRKEFAEGLNVSVTGGDDTDARENVVRRLKRLQHAELERILVQIDREFAELNSALTSRRPWLTWDEIEEMTQHGVACGSHTENHVILTKVPPSVARDEIRNSREEIAKRLRQPVNAFCYPNGAYDPGIAQAVRDAGYTLAVTTKSGPLSWSRGPFELTRILLHDDISMSPSLLACALSGVSTYRRRPRRESSTKAPTASDTEP